MLCFLPNYPASKLLRQVIELSGQLAEIKEKTLEDRKKSDRGSIISFKNPTKVWLQETTSWSGYTREIQQQENDVEAEFFLWF
jgi:hypothetical protein